MTGLWLARRSVAHRLPAFAATAVTVLLATAVAGSFATLVETAGGPVTAGDAETLVVIGSVVGAWGAVIALFSLVSTLGVAVRQRGVEVALLRTLGASGRLTRRLVVLEALAVAAVAVVPGLLLAAGGGRLLLEILRGGVVAEDVPYGAGPASLGGTAVAVLVVVVLAATVAARRATSGPLTLVLAEERSGTGRLPRWRVAAGLLLVAYGVGTGFVTVHVSAGSDDPFAAMQTSGSSGLLVGVGIAALGPVLLRALGRTAGLLGAGAGAGAGLAALGTARRPHLLAGVLGPVVVLVASAVSIAVLVSVDRRTFGAASAGADPAYVEAGDTINLLNTVVMTMICVFAALMVLNASVAVTSDRRGELARLRLLGATAAQVRAQLGAEARLVAVVGCLVGLLAALATVVPFSVARGEGAVPDGDLWLAPLLTVVAAAVTLGSAALAARRTCATLA